MLPLHRHPSPPTPLTHPPPPHPHPTLKERQAYLERVREAGDVGEVMFGVRSDLVRNLGNMTNAGQPCTPNSLVQSGLVWSGII